MSTKRTELNLLKSNRIIHRRLMVMQKAIRLLTDFISVQLSKNKISELFWTVIKLSKTSDG